MVEIVTSNIQGAIKNKNGLLSNKREIAGTKWDSSFCLKDDLFSLILRDRIIIDRIKKPPINMQIYIKLLSFDFKLQYNLHLFRQSGLSVISKVLSQNEQSHL